MSTPDRGSVIAQLRANRSKLLADRTKTLKVPGYDSLYARYRRLPWDKIEPLLGIGQSADPTQDIAAAMDVLIAACDEFVFIAEGEETPLGLTYEQGLAELLGVEGATTPAEVIAEVFVEELDLMNHAGDYVSWAMRMESEVSRELGNGSGQTSA